MVGRCLGAACRARMPSTGPVSALGWALAVPARTARAAASASIGSDLPRQRRCARWGRSTSTTSRPRAQPAAQAGPARAGALDPDPFDRPEAARLGQQRGGADVGAGDRVGPQEPTELVQGGDVL